MLHMDIKYTRQESNVRKRFLFPRRFHGFSSLLIMVDWVKLKILQDAVWIEVNVWLEMFMTKSIIPKVLMLIQNSLLEVENEGRNWKTFRSTNITQATKALTKYKRLKMKRDARQKYGISLGLYKSMLPYAVLFHISIRQQEFAGLDDPTTHMVLWKSTKFINFQF